MKICKQKLGSVHMLLFAKREWSRAFTGEEAIVEILTFHEVNIYKCRHERNKDYSSTLSSSADIRLKISEYHNWLHSYCISFNSIRSDKM